MRRGVQKVVSDVGMNLWSQKKKWPHQS